MKKENSLFGEPEKNWKKEWKFMPEYISENKKPIQQIIVSFKSFEDVQAFGKCLGIRVTPKTVSTWYPPKKIDSGDVYVNKNWGKDVK